MTSQLELSTTATTYPVDVVVCVVLVDDVVVRQVLEVDVGVGDGRQRMTTHRQHAGGRPQDTVSSTRRMEVHRDGWLLLLLFDAVVIVVLTIAVVQRTSSDAAAVRRRLARQSTDKLRPEVLVLLFRRRHGDRLDAGGRRRRVEPLPAEDADERRSRTFARRYVALVEQHLRRRCAVSRDFRRHRSVFSRGRRRRGRDKLVDGADAADRRSAGSGRPRQRGAHLLRPGFSHWLIRSAIMVSIPGAACVVKSTALLASVPRRYKIRFLLL